MPGDPSTCALNTSHPLTFNAIIQPNPANTVLNIKTTNETLKKIELWDVSGKIIFERAINAIELSVNVEGIKSGIYFCKIENAQNAFVVKKIIIAH
jgi:hypothetical protein